MISENIVPILSISNVTGTNIEKLSKKFLAYIPKRINYNNNISESLRIFFDGT